ncbi:Fe-S cluster assembly ATPase SufC [bacterium]|nr:Fe-S cluster assembly ATPase SufC [bacterium]
MLKIRELHVQVRGKSVLKGINLNIKKGERHVLMGPNACGKTTLALAIMGFPQYKISHGEIAFGGKLLNNLSIDERAKLGIALSLQSPPKININFGQFIAEIEAKFDSSPLLAFCKNAGGAKFGEEVEHFKSRNLNDGLSGGEKKRSELIQILAMRPKLIILDEIDSGVDIDSLKLVGEILDERDESMLIITHYRHILNYLRADKVHLLGLGKISVSGHPDKILDGIEHYGYKGYLKKLGICKECPLKECVVVE